MPLQKDPALNLASCAEGLGYLSRLNRLGYLSRLKRLGYCADHTPISSVEVAEVLELYFLRHQPEHARPRMTFIFSRLNKSHLT